MALTYSTNTTAHRIPLNLFSGYKKPVEKHWWDDILGFLEKAGFVVFAGLSFLLPETLPTLISLAAADFTFSTGIAVMSSMNNKTARKNLPINIAVQAIADILPVAHFAWKGVSAIKKIGLSVEELRSTGLATKLESKIEMITKDLNISNAAKKQRQLGEEILRAGKQAEDETVLGFASAYDRLGFKAGIKGRAYKNKPYPSNALPMDGMNQLAPDLLTSETRLGIDKSADFLRAVQADAEVEAYNALREFGESTDEFAKIARQWEEENLPRLTNFRTLSVSELKMVKRFYNTDKIVNKFSIRGMISYMNSSAGDRLTQRVQLLNANDAARELIKHIKLKMMKVLKGRFGAQMARLRDRLTRFFKLDSWLAKIRKALARGQGMVLFSDSEWLWGCRTINEDPLGTLFTLIVYFKNSKYPPRYIRGVSREMIIEFITAASKGVFYHRNWALSGNGRDISRALTFATGSLFAFLPLNALRRVESIITNFKSVGKKAASAKSFGDFASKWVTTFTKTIGRNSPVQFTRAATMAMLGGGGIVAQTAAKFAASTIKSLNIPAVSQHKLQNAMSSMTNGFIKRDVSAHGKERNPSIHFNKTPLINAGITTAQRIIISKSGRKNSAVRMSNRYVKTVYRGVGILYKK